MKPVLDRDLWDRQLAQPHKLAARATHVATGEAVPFSDGSVVQDANSASRSTADLTVPGEEWAPSSVNDLLAPVGNELLLERGLWVPGYSEPLMASFGLFLIEEAEVEDGPDTLETRLTLSDRSRFVIDAEFEEAGSVALGTNAVEVIRQVVSEGYPQFQDGLPEIDVELPTLHWSAGDDRWAFCQDIAFALGRELFFNYEGKLVMPVIPTVGLTPAFGLVEGQGGATVSDPRDYAPNLLGASRRWSRADAHNRWIWTGDNAENTAEYRGVATDDDPDSPTRYGGRFGKKPKAESSSVINTQDMADQAALGSKNKEVGILQSVDFGALVNPAVEPGDVVLIRRERTGINENHLIDQLTIPLTAEGSMNGITRTTNVSV